MEIIYFVLLTFVAMIISIIAMIIGCYIIFGLFGFFVGLTSNRNFDKMSLMNPNDFGDKMYEIGESLFRSNK